MKQLTIYSQRSVPIVAINTPDQVALSQLIAANPPDSGMKVVTYDTLRGYSRIPEELPPELSGMAAGKFANNAHAALNAARHFSENTIVVMHNMNGLLMSPSAQHGIIQGLHNLRDEFKRNRRMIVMLGSHFILPDAVRNDVVVIDDTIPNRDECKELVKKVMAMTGQDHEPLPEEIDAIHGLPEFQAEQALSIALKLKDGKAVYDVQEAWKLKQQLIGMTSGLSVWNGNDTFADVGGLDGVKTYLTRLFDGPEPPQVIVWLDEIEKSAIASAGDANGINSDMLGTMLSYMEDHNVLGVCLSGVPGTGKSAIVKAAGGQFNRLVIRLDLSAMKGSFVGESEANLRSGLRLISAVGGDRCLFVATSNSTDKLDVALQSRFSDTFWFNLPTEDELKPIWPIHKARLNLPDYKHPADQYGWVGRNIKQCCEKSYRMNLTLEEAAQSVIPVGVSAKDDIDKLLKAAAGRYLDAGTGKVVE